MAYATVADVAAYMNRSLTPAQEIQAQFYLDAASAWIDQHTGKTWNPSSPVTETHNLSQRFLYLYRKPIVAITSVVARDLYPGADSIPLTAGEQYEVLDAQRGLLVFEFGLRLGGPYDWVWEYPYAGYMLTIVYTHVITVPANIKLAATIMASQKMTSSINAMGQRLRSFSDNRGVSVTFKDVSTEAMNEVISLLPPRRVVVV